jgi:hypothetical protein
MSDVRFIGRTVTIVVGGVTDEQTSAHDYTVVAFASDQWNAGTCSSPALVPTTGVSVTGLLPKTIQRCAEFLERGNRRTEFLSSIKACDSVSSPKGGSRWTEGRPEP